MFLIHQRQLRYQYILSLIVPLFHSPHTLSFIIVEVTKSWKKNCGQFFCQQYKLRVEVIGLTKKDTKQHFFTVTDGISTVKNQLIESYQSGVMMINGITTEELTRLITRKNN